jgi:hypothetical protein
LDVKFRLETVSFAHSIMKIANAKLKIALFINLDDLKIAREGSDTYPKQINGQTVKMIYCLFSQAYEQI